MRVAGTTALMWAHRPSAAMHAETTAQINVTGAVASGILRPAGREGQARQCDHGIPAPVIEPVIAGDDGPSARGLGAAIGRRRPGAGACDDELIGGEGQLLYGARLLLHSGAAQEVVLTGHRARAGPL